MIVRVYQYVMAHHVPIRGRPTFICHETPKQAMKANEESNADVEVAIPVAQRVEGADEIACYTLPGGQMARIVHKGPYEDCARTYKQLFAWIAEHRKKIVGPTREVYLNDPRKIPPEEILTEIYAPIA